MRQRKKPFCRDSSGHRKPPPWRCHCDGIHRFKNSFMVCFGVPYFPASFFSFYCRSQSESKFDSPSVRQILPVLYVLPHPVFHIFFILVHRIICPLKHIGKYEVYITVIYGNPSCNGKAAVGIVMHIVLIHRRLESLQQFHIIIIVRAL